MNKATKIDAILNAWLDFIALEDFSDAKVPGNAAVLRGVELVGDYVRIDKDIFSTRQQALIEEKRNQRELTWALSFPQLFTGNNGKSEYFPLFSLNVTSILEGEYREEGWNLNGLELTEAGKHLAKFLKLDEEKSEQLITKEGLRRFLDTTFELDFETYEDWMKRVIIHCSYRIQRQPYLFEFKGSRYSSNLKRDLEDIKSSSRKWLNPGHPAYEYLFGKPKPPEHKVIYMGAFPTYPPTESQLKALKHAQSESMTAVQGPPGSGKTTLILHLVAQQVVRRALKLIETGEDINNLTVVSSTNNKAVENVIEKLDKSLENELFYLKGGNTKNISGVREKLQQALDYLQRCSFDENHSSYLAQEIRQIKQELVTQEKQYLELSEQYTLDEARQPRLQEKLQELHSDIDTAIDDRSRFEMRAVALEHYAQLPINAYQRIRVNFDIAELQLPEGALPWWKRLWFWLTGKGETNVLLKTALACQSAIENTLNTPFPVEVPTSRSLLVQQARLVRERLNNAQELRSVQNNLGQVNQRISRLEQERYETHRELTALNNRLAVPLKDFYSSFHSDYHEQHKKLFELSRQFLKQEVFRNKENVTRVVKLYSDFLSGDYKAKQRISKNLDEYLKALSLIFPVITSTLLSVRNMLPSPEECIDRVIIDEAGMIPLHQTFPLLVRSRQAIIVGDPLQIEPVINLSNQSCEQYYQTAFIERGLTENDYHCYSPEEIDRATTYHRAAGVSGEAGDAGQGILLREHHRCQRSIIEFCNRIAGYGLEVKTEATASLLESNLIAYHVEGSIRGNINQEEVTAVRELMQHLISKGYSLEDIGVISAFRGQADALRVDLQEKFSGLRKEDIGTVHTFQGAEKKVIILSTKVCRLQDNVNWLNKRPNLLNVAVSRAKELFILIGNLYRLEKGGGFTRQLVEYIREHGEILEYKGKGEIPQEPTGSSLVFDCSHIGVFRDAIHNAEQELMIVTPWIRGSEPKQFAKDIISALERGVKVTVIYGYKGGDENDDNDAQTEKDLKELFSQYPGSCLIRLGEERHLESRGTHEKMLVCDTKFAILGSWNWLSHFYRGYCSKLRINHKVIIRRETSVKLSDSSSVLSVKERIVQLISGQS